MSRRWWIISVLIGVVVVASGLFVYAWNSQLFVSSRYLQVSGFTPSAGWYGANVLDHNATVASIGVLAYNGVAGNENEVPVTVSIWHEWGTDLKSLELIFSGNDAQSMALSVLQGSPWPSVQFTRTSDGTGILFYAADLGAMGTGGTVTVGFYIETNSGQQTLNYNIYFQLTFQNGGPFTFSKEIAETQLYI